VGGNRQGQRLGTSERLEAVIYLVIAFGRLKNDRTDYRKYNMEPEKFEGLPAYVVVFWELALEGLADEVDGTVFKFNITPEVSILYPELKAGMRLLLTESTDGFVFYDLLPQRRTN
jgi:hypothetical protein